MIKHVSMHGSLCYWSGGESWQGWLSATGNGLVKGKLRSAGIHPLLGAQLRSAGPLLARSVPSVLVSAPACSSCSLELDAGVGCFLGDGVR